MRGPGRRRAAALGALCAGLLAAPGPASAAEAVEVGAVAVVDALATGPGVAERLDEIRRRLQAALVYPPVARRLGLSGVAWVRFEIDRSGAPREVDVARSSGHPILDRAARRTVDRAGRLPWVHGWIEVPIRFALDGPA